MSLVTGISSTNPNHQPHHVARSARNPRQQPSVENAKGRLYPTQAEEATQLSGNHTTVEELNVKAEAKNPLIAAQKFNAKIATTRF